MTNCADRPRASASPPKVRAGHCNDMHAGAPPEAAQCVPRPTYFEDARMAATVTNGGRWVTPPYALWAQSIRIFRMPWG
jgi:hypothetical protein